MNQLFRHVTSCRETGLGNYLQATSAIPKGITLFEEIPFLVTKNVYNPKDIQCSLKKENNILHLTQLQKKYQLPYKPWKISLLRLITRFSSTAPHPDIHPILLLNGYQWHGTTNTQALFSQASSLNHSCAPNTIVQLSTESVKIRTLRDITTDEPLTSSYVTPFELLMPNHLRRERIADKKFFVCQCPKCLSSLQPERTFSCSSLSHTCSNKGTVIPCREDNSMSTWEKRRGSSFLFRIITDL